MSNTNNSTQTIVKKKPGKPLKFKSVKELQKKIDAFFAKCDKEREPYTITGLALALDTSRRTLLDYETKERYSQYSHAIKRAKNKCEGYLEKGMLNGKIPTIAAIFNAKNNYGWKDKTETEITANINITSILDALESGGMDDIYDIS